MLKNKHAPCLHQKYHKRRAQTKGNYSQKQVDILSDIDELTQKIKKTSSRETLYVFIPSFNQYDYEIFSHSLFVGYVYLH